MASSTTTVPPQAQTETIWLRLAQLSVVLGVAAVVVFAAVGMLFSTISEGDFKYTADYWYTGVGLPISLAGIGLGIAAHRLQHGADGRLGTIGVWINTVALVELFVQLGCSVVSGSEVRWGPSYVVFTLLTFLGVALLASGSWRTGLLPRWMLGIWPPIWVLGSFAATGPMPVLLAAFLVLLVLTLTRRTHARTA